MIERRTTYERRRVLCCIFSETHLTCVYTSLQLDVILGKYLQQINIPKIMEHPVARRSHIIQYVVSHPIMVSIFLSGRYRTQEVPLCNRIEANHYATMVTSITLQISIYTCTCGVAYRTS